MAYVISKKLLLQLLHNTVTVRQQERTGEEHEGLRFKKRYRHCMRGNRLCKL